MENKKIQNYFFFLLLSAVLITMLFVFKSYLSILVISAALAIIFEPLNKKILKIVGNKRAISSLLTLVIILLVVLAPLSFFAFKVFQEGQGLYSDLTSDFPNPTKTVVNSVQETLTRLSPDLAIDFDILLKQGIEWTLKHLGSIFLSFTSFILNLLLGIIALFYFLKDGPEFKKAIIEITPLSDEYDQEIYGKIKNAINSVVRGSLLNALIYGVLIGIGVKIFGGSNATLWGLSATIAALVPGVGVALVLIPAVLFLWITTNSLFSTAGLFIWGFLANMMVDNFITPKMMQIGMKVHPLLILFSVLGGISLWGPIGFLLGPIALSLFFALLKIYPKLISA